jgi:hypothetical protein
MRPPRRFETSSGEEMLKKRALGCVRHAAPRLGRKGAHRISQVPMNV